MSFARGTRGAATVDWVVLSAGVAALGAAVVAVLASTEILDGDVMSGRPRAEARAHSVGIAPADPGMRAAPRGPVYDPGGWDPGAVTVPAPLPAAGQLASDAVSRSSGGA